MLPVKHRFETFEEYLSYDDHSEKLHELFNGELIEVPPEPGFNIQIANRLFLTFALMLGTDRVRGHGLELELTGDHYTEVGNFGNNNSVISPQFRELDLKVSEVFGE